MTPRRDIKQLAAELQQLTGEAFGRRLEAALHQTWNDGWEECQLWGENEYPVRNNPYNILTRVPEGFLKAAQQHVAARVEAIEAACTDHLFPGLFPAQTIPLRDVERAGRTLASGEAPLLGDRAPHYLSPAEHRTWREYLASVRTCRCPADWFEWHEDDAEKRLQLSRLPHGYELPGKERTELVHHVSCPKYFDDGNGEPDSCVRRFCGICCYSFELCDCDATGRR